MLGSCYRFHITLAACWDDRSNFSQSGEAGSVVPLLRVLLCGVLQIPLEPRLILASLQLPCFLIPILTFTSLRPVMSEFATDCECNSVPQDVGEEGYLHQTDQSEIKS